MEKKILVRIENLSKNFPVKKTKKKLSALHHISLDIRQGEILSLVGESGCGKSTLAKVIVGLLDKDGGEIAFAEKDKNKKWIQMVFQDPYSCLNPKKKIISTLTEVLKVHRIGKAGDRERIVADMLHRCGLNESVFKKYPGELSGGQCQRVSIARALLMKPDLLIADEPISALDVSVQAQIVNMLMDLKDEMDLTILFISHDLEIVRHLSDRIAVMYLGEIVEIADKNELFANPLHPYTKLLLASAPGIESEKKDEIQEKSLTELPNAIDLPPGCRFCSRCTFAGAQCESDPPVLKEIKRGHFAACRICEES